MSVLAVETTSPTRNPLDIVEEIVAANEWPFDRVSDDEMVVEISGRWCDYRLYFVWQEEISALQFSCQFDMKVQHPRRSAVNDLLAEVNAKLWIGHFDLWPEDGTIVFRHAMIFPEAHASASQMECLLNLALEACEHYYPAFQFVLWGGKTAQEAVAAAILECQGQA